MGNKKITNLPSATAVNAGDKVEIVQGGTSKQVDANLLSGSGLSGLTTNKVLKAGSATTAVDSQIYDDGSTVNIGTTTGSAKFNIQIPSNSNGASITDLSTIVVTGIYSSKGLIGTTSNNDLGLVRNGTEQLILTSSGLNTPLLTASQIVATDASKNLVSLSTATYPSLTELSYAKGVTSSIQTQLDGLAPIASPTFTGTPLAPTASANTNNTQIATTAYVDSKSLFRTTTDSSTHTGTLTNTIIWSEDISNKLSSGDIAEIISDVVRVSGASSANIRYYLNSSASLSGATQIGVYTYGFSGLNIADFRRQLIVKSSTVIRVKGSVSGPLNDYSIFSNYADVTVNLASLHVIFAITLGNTGDQFLVSSRKMVR